MPTRLTAAHGAFRLDGQPLHLLSGELHYFRVPREIWSESLYRIRALGVRAISTYIPWVWHEPREGFFDFTGLTHPRRDLVGFLSACREQGLVVLARPGPLIYAEFEGLGVPLWLGEKHPESVVLRRDGSQDRGDFYFNHSLLHPIYREHVRRWYRVVIGTLRPFFEDPVVSFQIDNETGLLYLNRVGEVDFNSDTVARYRAFLETRYGTVAELNQTWSTRHRGFERILPPRPPLRQPQLHDWQEFIELMICRYLVWLRDVSLDLGVRVPLAHNEQGMHHSPAHVCDKTGLVQFIGYDLYPKASPGRHTLDFPFAVSFYPGLFRAYADETRPLWGSEMGTGWMDPRAKVSEEAVIQNLFGSLAQGSRGLNLFPIHDGREPQTGARYRFRTALDEEGRYTPRARTLDTVGRFLETHGERLLTCEPVYDPVAFGVYYPNFRFVARDFLPHSLYPDPHRFLSFLGLGGIHGLLIAAGFVPRVVDLGEQGDEDRRDDLARVACVVTASKGLLDERTYRRLERWVQGGGHLVCAPVPPTRTPRGFPARYTPLFPVAPSRLLQVDRWRSYATMAAGLLRYWLFHRSRLREEHLGSGHVIELYEPVLHLLRTPARGLLHEQPWGEPIPGDYLAAFFDLGTSPAGEDAEPGPLRALRKLPRGAVSSYRVRCGSGTSTVLGTIPGGRYGTPRYYTVPDETRIALRRFARGLLAERGVTPSFETEIEAEFVPHRAADGGGFLFVINRLDEQRGRVKLRDPAAWGYHGHLRVAYSFLGSGGVTIDRETLELELRAQDVLVLSFPPPSEPEGSATPPA